MPLILRLLVFIFCAIFLACGSPPDLFVSTRGDDNNPGTRERPFASLERAQAAVRVAFESGSTGNITVHIDTGVYFLLKPLEFSPDDSGRDDIHVTYKSEYPGKSIFSGGQNISQWQWDAQSQVWFADLPQNEEIPWLFRELFLNGKRLTRARHPNLGFLYVDKSGSDHRTNFYFNETGFKKPKNVPGVELVFFHDWSTSRLPLDNINYENHQMFAKDSIGAKSLEFFTIDHWEPHPRYYLENDLAFLDSIYEWFLDDEAKRVYLKLPENVIPDSFSIIAPKLNTLLDIRGSFQQSVQNIVFDGLQFNHCQWSLPNKRYGGIQACHHDQKDSIGEWSVIPGAVQLSWAENVTFDHCTFARLGGSGLQIGTATKNCSVENSHFEDISGNGIMIGEGQHRKIDQKPWWKAAPGQVAMGNSIANCQVNRVGTQFYGAVGIWCGLTRNTSITNNHIYDLPYTGVSVGWMWSDDTTPCEQNIITANHIHDIMQVLSDGGGIYMLGRQPNSKISDNLIYNVKINAGRAESNGIFIDEGSTEISIENNLIFNIAKSPLRFHRAGVNYVRNNTLVTPDSIPPIRFNNTPVDKIIDKNNIVYTPNDFLNSGLIDPLAERLDLENLNLKIQINN